VLNWRVESRLQEHPELLADVMKAMEVRLDHARVVLMFRKESALPLIKDYLLNVQKTNILEVRHACKTTSRVDV
jgi:clathrin heavy chain